MCISLEIFKSLIFVFDFCLFFFPPSKIKKLPGLRYDKKRSFKLILIYLQICSHYLYKNFIFACMRILHAHLGQNLIRIHAHVILASHADVISALHATLNLAQIRYIACIPDVNFLQVMLFRPIFSPHNIEMKLWLP